MTTHGYALNVDLDPAPFTDWITACGLEDAAFTTIARELGRPVTVDEVRPLARAALEEVFELELDELPADDGAGLWAQPVHERLAAAELVPSSRDTEPVLTAPGATGRATEPSRPSRLVAWRSPCPSPSGRAGPSG